METIGVPSVDEPPCQRACPLGTDARGYILLTSAGKFTEAYQLARADNPLVATCGCACSAQCEAACTRRELDRPIAIRRIKRFLSDRYADHQSTQQEVAQATGKSVAIIGCGPAGLAAAHDLALLGHGVTIFDGADEPGGMAALGIPRFRLPLPELERDISEIRALGVDIISSTRVGRDIAFSEIRARFDSVFIAVGSHQPVPLEIPGAHLAGTILALPWLEQANLAGRATCGPAVVVIGGGYTAMDVARTALRLGASQVSVIYRRSRLEMEVHEEELEEAEEEGVGLFFLASPVRYLSTDGHNVSGVEFIRNKLGEKDLSGRRRPVPIPDSEFAVDADTVILAVGQRPDVSFIHDSVDASGGSLRVDAETMQTNVQGVFAGGDCTRGSGTIVEAIADGKRAAESIHRYLGFESGGDCIRASSLCSLSSDHLFEGIWLSRKPPAMLKADVRQRRRQFYMEVEPTLHQGIAVTEALRCLYCGLQPRISADECTLCCACLSICPSDCIQLVAEVGEDGSPNVWTDSAKNAIAYAIDEDRCIRCGQCARVCPTGAIGFPSLAYVER